jgi:hypothetical protein
MESILKPRAVPSPVYANVPGSRARRRAGVAMTAIATLFLLFDSVSKLVAVAPAVQGTVQLGYSDSTVRVLGIILLACVILYVLPRTSVLGAVLLTGYLGGAVASQFRVGSPLLTHTLFPIYVGLLIWGGLVLREDRLRALLPLRR